MRHYEITLIVHPDQSGQIDAIINKYSTMATESGGIVHRQEDWGRRYLAYPIQKLYKGHYLLFNFECTPETCEDMSRSFRFNDAIIRNLIINKKNAETDPSPMMLRKKKEEEKISAEARLNAEKAIERDKEETRITGDNQTTQAEGKQEDGVDVATAEPEKTQEAEANNKDVSESASYEDSKEEVLEEKIKKAEQVEKNT